MAEGNAKGWTFDTFETWVSSTNEERAKAITVAFNNFEKRMDGTNEWRAAFSDLTQTMASKEALQSLASQVQELKDKETKSGSRAEGAGIVGARLLAGLGAAGTVFGIIAVILVFNQ